MEFEIDVSGEDILSKKNDIKENLRFFLNKRLGLKINESIFFSKLDKKSNAHKYAFLMREDRKNKMNTYVEIKLQEFEQWLIK